MKSLFRILAVVGACICLAVPSALAATGKAHIHGTGEDSALEGWVTLEETPLGVDVTVTLQEAPPGKHGFHVHEYGTCEEMGKAAGGHFNPEGTPHGFLPQDGAARAHAGDLGNIEIGPDGQGSLTISVTGLSLTREPYDVAGRAIIVHEKEDDFGQPTGNAGARIGCGAILLSS